LLVYLHVPFCSAKCHFCDWVVGYDKAELLDARNLRDSYVEALCQQIATYGAAIAAFGYQVTNVYWGGGTPTRLSAGHLAEIHAAMADAFDLSTVLEHTAECSPETLTVEHLEQWCASGLNRLSIGVQSFDDTVLRRMGRPHSAETAECAIERARAVGVQNLNIDLIVGFPEQDRDSVLASVRRAIALDVPHLSVYMFREFATGLVAARQVQAGWRRQSSRTDRVATYWAAKSLLEEAGYHEYMVGYFAREPRFEFDGEKYYFGLVGDYFGFGAGASSTIGRCALRSGEASRYGAAQVRPYLDNPLAMNGSPLGSLPDEVYLQSYFKAFAQPEGIRFERWLDQFGFPFHELTAGRPRIRQWFSEIEEAGGRFVETSDGIALSDDTRWDVMLWRA
jgi:oxygen-independent coproporphyrinogen-3 oxidase